MADNDLTVHITADDMRPAFETIRMILDAHSHEVDSLRERIQRLEALPGVAEALAAADTEGDK